MKNKWIEEERICRICGKVLSHYNKTDSCFCHQGGEEELHTEGLCTSRTISGQFKVDRDYYGCGYDSLEKFTYGFRRGLKSF